MSDQIKKMSEVKLNEEFSVRIFCSECAQYLSWCIDCLTDFCPGCENCHCDNECAR